MTTWRFTTTDEGWDTSLFSFNAGDGSPAAGCMSASTMAAGVAQSFLSGLTSNVTLGDACSFQVKYSVSLGGEWSAFLPIAFTIKLFLTIDATPYEAISESVPVTALSQNTGWLPFSGTIPATGVLSQVLVDFTSEYTLDPHPVCSFDTVVATTDDDPPTGFGFTHSAGGIPGAIMETPV